MSALVVAGDVSGTCTLQAPSAAGSTVLTLPVIATDTLAGIAATQTLTNKTLVAPALGTPASGVLTNCTGVVSGALPAGSVLQVVNATYSTLVTNITNVFADTGLTATITPTRNTSKILVIVHHSENYKLGLSSDLGIQILRGATVLSSISLDGGFVSATPNYFSISGSYTDSPATTSATTYKTQFRNTNFNGNSVVVQQNNVPSTMILMEIAV
jgi:hypothetical protein